MARRIAIAMLTGAVLLAEAPQASATARATDEYVRVKGTRFMLKGAPYYFVGANFWYGANLGIEKDEASNRRLERELDRLRALGVTNLRVMAATEGPDSEPWRISPAIQPEAGIYRDDLLRGLDRLLVEMHKRGMRAVVCLNNFWPWSGGMAQYLAWSGAGSIPYPPPQAGGSWDDYSLYTQQFYSTPTAVATANHFIETIIRRVNYYTGRHYSEDPTIMAWQLANEPRGVRNTHAFNAWIDKTAALIKRLDKNHLVTTGSEGETPWPASAGNDFVLNHSSTFIDYATAHVWVENWGIYDPKAAERTYDKAVEFMRHYLAEHMAKAEKLKKPLVLEEFGIARDERSYSHFAKTSYRDRYYREVFNAVYESARAGSALAGSNFWAWGGEGKPREAGGLWRTGDPFIGDPPHEQQGWYSIYAEDRSTHAVISEFAAKMNNVSINGLRP